MRRSTGEVAAWAVSSSWCYRVQCCRVWLSARASCLKPRRRTRAEHSCGLCVLDSDADGVNLYCEECRVLLLARSREHKVCEATLHSEGPLPNREWLVWLGQVRVTCNPVEQLS